MTTRFNPRISGLLLICLQPHHADGGTKRLPVLNQPVRELATAPGSTTQINLNQYFGTEPIDDQVVRFNSQFNSGGSPIVLDFALFSNRTPNTRTNFLKYVTDGDYNASFIHRSVPGFVIQGGGFKIQNSSIANVPTDAPILNEFGVSNTLATVSMAKVGGDPNSATSQWFVSLGANSNTLDGQNSGFTVFGRVTKGTFANAQLFGNPSEFPIWNAGGALSEMPLHKTFTNSQGQYWPNFLILFPTVSLVPLPADQAGESSVLTYSVSGNSNSGFATISITNSTLSVTPLAGQTGPVNLTIRATDSVGNTVDDTFYVGVPDTYSTWAARTMFPGNQGGANQNPDGDSLNNLQEYAFFGAPGTTSQTQVPARGSTGATPSGNFMTLSFPVRKLTTGLTYVVESANQLDGTWTTVWSTANGLFHSQVFAFQNQSDRTQVTIKDTVPMGSQSRRFMRVKVVQN